MMMLQSLCCSLSLRNKIVLQLLVSMTWGGLRHYIQRQLQLQ